MRRVMRSIALGKRADYLKAAQTVTVSASAADLRR